MSCLCSWRGLGSEAWLGRSRLDAPQAISHDTHRMHILQQLTLSSRGVTRSSEPSLGTCIHPQLPSQSWRSLQRASGPDQALAGQCIHPHARAHYVYMSMFMYVFDPSINRTEGMTCISGLGDQRTKDARGGEFFFVFFLLCAHLENSENLPESR